MKKTIIFAIAGLLTIVACKKAENVSEVNTSETNVINENGVVDSTSTSSSKTKVNGEVTEEEYSYAYLALDKSRAKATFTKNRTEDIITIEANYNKFVLDKKSNTPEGAIYERNGISAEVKGDSLIIRQDNTEIPLVRTGK